MNEVSCRTCEIFFRACEERGLDPSRLAAGMAYSLAELRDKRAWIPWSQAVILWRNAGRTFSPVELEAIGARFIDSPAIRSITLVARLLFDATDFYRWTSTGQKGTGNQLFSCVEPSFRQLDERNLVIEFKLPSGYERSPEFFRLTLGGLKAMPQLSGQPPAQVTMEPTGEGARYHIRVEPSRNPMARVRRALNVPLNLHAAATELKDTNERLLERNRELEAARQVLNAQAQQLSTAHSIGQLVHGDLDLDRTLNALAHALVDLAGCSAARVQLVSELETGELREAVAGQPASHLPREQRDVKVRGRSLGRVVAWIEPPHHARVARLLDFLQPTMGLALENALSYAALTDYRQNLERKVEARTAELIEAQAARDRIFANINHEIRTPLSLVMTSVAQLERVAGGRAEVLSQGGIIERSARKLLRLVDELLLLAAGQERKLRLERAPIDLAVLLRQMVASWSAAAGDKGLTLALSAPESAVARVDAEALERVIANLLSNALKFTPPGGSVHLELVDADEHIGLTVRDTGIGIDDELERRLFGRFEQGRPSPLGAGRGSGIGLSLVKQLVEAHEGTVEVERPDGGGTRFRIWLPRPERIAATAEPPALALEPGDFGHALKPSLPPRVEEGPSGRPTVLLAEDDVTLAHTIAGLLDGEYRVLVAYDGLSAMALAEKELPDLLLSDVGMPGMDGIELARRFRQLEHARLAPVLLLTAYGRPVDRLAGFAAGAVDYIIKPFDPDELKARVKAQLALRELALKLHETEKLAALGTLAAGLAHEVRNPANAIVNAIEPLKQLLPPSLLVERQPVGQLVAVLESCAQQICFLSRQLLGFRKEGELARTQQPFAEVVARAVAIAGPLVKQVRFVEEIAYAGPVACAAPLVSQVVANLLENAVHAALDGAGEPWVRLSAKKDGTCLVIDVCDSGHGVPPELRERIFEPFFTTKTRGTGLGLSLARDIALRHGGSLKVSDGSLFRFELPLSIGARN